MTDAPLTPTLHGGPPLKESPSQTAGPYVHIGCTPSVAGVEGVYPHDLGSGPVFDGDVEGHPIVIEGRVLDGAGAPMRDAMVEIWQPDGNGRFPGGTQGWARRACANEAGTFRFETVKPGSLGLPDGRMQAPHVTLWIAARGVNIALQTRVYFAEDIEAHATDPLLMRIENPERRETLIARGEDGVYRHDIRVRGAVETVFFDL